VRRSRRPRLTPSSSSPREIWDRWLEHVNGAGGAGEMMLESAGKYDVSRALPEAPSKVLALPSAIAA